MQKIVGDEQTAYPLADCPDSYYAEGFASAYAVQALARHFPSHSDVQECVIIGDNSSILNYWRRTARVRRWVLATVLQQAQLLAATELPRISWRYVPREANRRPISLRVSLARLPRVMSLAPSVLRRRLTLDGMTSLHPPFRHNRPSAWPNAQHFTPLISLTLDIARPSIALPWRHTSLLAVNASVLMRAG